MIEILSELDNKLFLLINKNGSSEFLDGFLPWWREKRNWVPLYILLGIFVVFKFRKQCWLWILSVAACVGSADAISSHLLKPGIGRLRPCQEGSAVVEEMVLRLSNCPGNGSFTSSHAANHFALAFFIILSLQSTMGVHRWWFLPWAIIICWAQVYVGVHYPGDILGGALLGLALASLFNFFYKKLQRKLFHIG